jgi:ABC-type amino acid transport substrate-binding protein
MAIGLAIGMSAMVAKANDNEYQVVDFGGGDGSYKHAVDNGVVLAIANDNPFTFQDEKTKEYDGIDVRIMKEIMKRIGVTKIEWTLVPFDSLIAGLGAKRWDVIVDNLHVNPKRIAVVSFTSPAYWYGSSLAVQKGNPKNIHTWDDLKGKIVGTLRGSINQSVLEKRNDLKEMKLYANNESEFADLIAGRIDVAMEDGLKIGQFLKNHPEVALEAASGYEPQPDEYGYARYTLRKGDLDLNNAVSRALDELRADGTVSKILAEYGFSDRNLWYFPPK